MTELLHGVQEKPEAAMTDGPGFRSIVDWLRAGYPDGVPDDDYAALMALLAPRRLSQDEVADIAGQLKQSSGAPLGRTNGTDRVIGAVLV